jgi:hypothetical protein
MRFVLLLILVVEGIAQLGSAGYPESSPKCEWWEYRARGRKGCETGVIGREGLIGRRSIKREGLKGYVT